MLTSRRALRAAVTTAVTAVLVLSGLVAAGALPGSPAPAAGQAARTWVVDAVDDADGNSWRSRDTGTSRVTIAVGDTVEWRFEWPTARQEHDLTSVDTPAGTWVPPVQEYRTPDDPDGPVRHTFTAPGTYSYTCSIHGTMMTGTVVVTESGEPGGEAPTVDASATPTTGPAPLDVAFSGSAQHAGDGELTYVWDFGDGVTGAGAEHQHSYASPGRYTATLAATDADGVTGTDTVDITVTDAHAHHELPHVSATATPASGTAPLAVAFSAEVSTSGPFRAFAHGLTAYPELTGTATMVRRRGATHASLDVSGLKARAMHMVHVHEEACSSNNAGAHFRFDEALPFEEANEIWLPFTSDAHGRSGLVEVVQPQRADEQAVSVVIHDPDNPALRIGCVDLAPSVAGLTYAWDFGDGSTGRGTDPHHVYAASGTHTAKLTVADGHGNTDIATVAVAVAAPPGPTPVDTAAPDTAVSGGPEGVVRARRATFTLTSTEAGSTFTCSLDGAAWQACPATARFAGLDQGRHRLLVRASDAAGNADATPASHEWAVDRTAPVVRAVRPSVTTDRTPTLRARVRDAHSSVRRVVLQVDGARVAPVRHVARRGQVRWTPRRPLALGRHTARLVVVDAAGNRQAATWTFRVRR
ncbi:PKD domain-containing protein [Nocardioides sp. zg-1228]|uniref:PKD domain-containing protein n=1 Tax=Nocardioides sp. zg-1228 TaxID=2763008 RepID=UPI001642B6F4|nr:PKD domain-containing protein [Nocardioides sp. zg-1228]MBC2932519.1 PKD domain-containing protein [Nocardioides sp. zg-1228]QSF58019.1 PKD domain-containing protein [Nocardioides sp. zg-1228]